MDRLIDYIFEIMLTYNNKDTHSATNMTPNEARKKDNEFRARVNIASKARKEKLYPEINVGDKVKIIRKKSNHRKGADKQFFAG